MISALLSAAVEGYAALDRATDRRRLLAEANARVEASARAGRPRLLVVVRSPAEGRALQLVRSGSAVVFLDCALERSDAEEELLALWTEARRAAGDDDHLFVLSLQPWATGRLLLDPRVRWVVLGAPPRAPLTYRPYGRRSRLLADVRNPPRPPRPHPPDDA